MVWQSGRRLQREVPLTLERRTGHGHRWVKPSSSPRPDLGPTRQLTRRALPIAQAKAAARTSVAGGNSMPLHPSSTETFRPA